MQIGKFFLIGATLAFAANTLLAQVDSVKSNPIKADVPKSDCEASLAIATGEFNAGRFFSLPAILGGCLDKGFTKEQKVRAYILLCQVYLINDNPQEAEASYLKLLQADPEYVANTDLDPVDVVYLSKKFTTRPVLTPHVRMGTNTSFTTLVHENPTEANIDRARLNKNINLGFSVGGGLDWNLSDRVSVSGDVIYSQRRYSRTKTDIFDLDRSELLMKLSWIDVPIYIKYQKDKGRLRPFGYAGYAVHFNIASKAKLGYWDISTSETGDGQNSQKPTEGTDVTFTEKHYRFNQSLVAGGGLKYKVGKNYLFADLRVMLGLTNITNPDKLFQDGSDLLDNNIAKYNVVTDLVRVSSINLSVGYIFPVYNPRKKGNWQPKGFIGKILYGKSNVVE